MDKKQVIIVSLLVIAIVLSTASVMLNVSVISGINIQQAPITPSVSTIDLNVQPTPENTGGPTNGLG